MVKKILVLARKTIKLIILLGISILLIICAVALFFKPIYGVTLNGEQIGYSKDKSKLQAKINKYMECKAKNERRIAIILKPFICSDKTRKGNSFNLIRQS